MKRAAKSFVNMVAPNHILVPVHVPLNHGTVFKFYLLTITSVIANVPAPCTSSVNYNIPSNYAATAKSTELVIDADAYYMRMVGTGNFTGGNSTTCLTSLRSFACVSKFPKCMGTNTNAGTDWSLCRSTCESAFYCGNFFARGNFSISDVSFCADVCRSSSASMVTMSIMAMFVMLCMWLL